MPTSKRLLESNRKTVFPAPSRLLHPRPHELHHGRLHLYSSHEDGLEYSTTEKAEIGAVGDFCCWFPVCLPLPSPKISASWNWELI